MFFVLAEERLS